VSNNVKNVLSIAGSDPSGGAGIQADLKTFAANGVYGMAAITALTVQNTVGVQGIHLVPAKFVSSQIEAIFSDIAVSSAKVGMVGNAEIAEGVGTTLAKYRNLISVVDPVMVAKGGSPLLDKKAIQAVKDNLIPLATIVTPNLPEAAILLGSSIAKSEEDMVYQGKALLNLGPKSILMKGGHSEGITSNDLLVTENNYVWFKEKRINTKNTHGTGCTLSSSIASFLAKDFSVEESVSKAKKFVTNAIRNSEKLSVGKGHGPTNHFYALEGSNKIIGE
tara:strand:+ start:4217 stop:5047 length:831 start_codon:yes stop_codon:yes gene_type:complete